MGKLTLDQRKDVIKRRREGETLIAIATRYDISESAVCKIVKGIIPKTPIRRSDAFLSDEQVKDAISRRINGETLEAIAMIYGVSSHVVHRATNHAKPPEGWSRRKMTTSQKSEAIKRRMDGEALVNIALSYGVTSPYIHQIVKKAIPQKE